MCDGPTEIFECIWVNIWCMLDWIWSQNCRDTLLLHTAGQLVGAQKKDAFYISNWGSGIDRMERYQIIKAGTSVRAGFHNVLREKKKATIALCGLSVKRQLFCDFVRWHISRGPQKT